MTTQTGGELLVQCLVEQGVKRVFCIPGESYLAVLDGLHGSKVQTIVARQEGGAAMMAEADGKLTGRPGVCFVTRGPGATNASAGVHIAQQDSTPMVLFVGQISRGWTGRDAFQEVDYRLMFGGMAKLVEQIEDAARLPEVIARRVEVAEPSPSAAQMDWFKALLSQAKRPFAIVGGSRWHAESVRALRVMAEKWMLPVGCSFRSAVGCLKIPRKGLTC